MHTVKQLLSQSAAEKIVDPQTCLQWVSDISAAYHKLHRPALDSRDIVDVKLSTSFWRSRLLDRLLTQAPRWLAEQQEKTVEILRTLNVRFSDRQRGLASRLLDEPALAQIMARQGIPTPGYPGLEQESGPGRDLDIVANRSSSMPFEKWRTNDHFSRYEFEQEGVRYRGVSFRPGDVLLANVNLDGNGVYTALTKPRGFSSHSAFLAVLEHHGKRFPVVIETYEKGVRPVPLSVFLGPRFSSYVEVYRHTEYSPQHASKINQAATEFINSVRGYNFNTEDPDPSYMSCTAVGRFMHQAAGLKPVRTISRLCHPKVVSNMEKLGYTFADYLSPVDFLLNDCFHHVGVVDNNQIERLLARELIDRDFQRQFINSELEPGKFPFPYKLNCWGIGQMRKQTLIGKLIGLIEGFSVDNLPKGPDELLGVILLAEKQIGKAIVKTRVTVEQVIADYEHLDMEAFTADERISQALRRNFKLPWLQPLEAGIGDAGGGAPLDGVGLR